MRRQRGYNLVEIAIVLAVFLMLSSLLFTSYFEAQEERRVQQTQRQIEQIKTAIVDYAVANTSRGFILHNAATATTVSVQWAMPPGRPYLPCPDITGDGVEDRVPNPAFVLLPAGFAREVTLTAGDYTEIYDLDCHRYKGMVPWRTLNTPATDAWGNRFTYRVDPDFAYSLLGFDQHTQADDSTGILPLELQTRADGSRLVLKASVPPDVKVNVPTTGNAAVAAIWGGDIESENAPSLICSSVPCSAESVQTLGNGVHGVVATVQATVSAGRYGFDLPVAALYVPRNIISGLPVVVLSHGKNGHGAVVGGSEGANMRCNPIPLDNESERQNAYWGSATAGCPQVVPMAPEARQNGFVVQPRTPPEALAGEFDDIVGWMSSEELAQRLVQRGIFPVEGLPPLGLEGR